MKKKLKYRLKIILAGFIILTSFSLKSQNDIIDIGIRYEFPPYSFISSNQEYNGFAVDFFNKILSDKYKLKFKQYKDLNESIDCSIIGIICDARVPLGYTFIPIPHRLEYYVFMRTNSEIQSLANLYNKRIIVTKNDLPFEVLYQNRTAHILQLPSFYQPLVLLNKGINDCAILPYYTGTEVIRKEKLENISYIFTPYLSYQAGIGVRSDNKELIKEIKIRVNEAIRNNDYHQIARKWFEEPVNCHTEELVSKQWIFIPIFLILIIIILIVFHILYKNELQNTVSEQISFTSINNLTPLLFPINEKIIQNVMGKMPVWILINDSKGIILQMSKSFLNEGMNALNLPVSCAMNEYFDTETLSKFTQWDEDIFSLRKKYVAEKTKIIINDVELEKYIIKYPIQLVEKGEVYIMNLFLDQAISGEAAFKQSSSNILIKKTINAIPDIILFKNTNGKIVDGNKAMYSWLEKPEREIKGKTLIEILGNETGLKYDKTDPLVSKTGIAWEGKIIDTINGEERILMCYKTPLKTVKNEISGLIVILKDITAIEAAKKEMEAAKSIVAESNRIKSSFLANMSHEIRTPMNSIIGFTDLLADTDLTSDQRSELIDIIQRSGYSLVDLIDDIIEISKIESGQINLKYTNINLNQIVEDAFNYAKIKRLQFHKEDVEISYQIGSIKDVYFINTDPFRMKQILKNFFNTTIAKSYDEENIDFGYILLDDEIMFYYNKNHNKVTKEFAVEIVNNIEHYNFSFNEVEEHAGVSVIIAKSLIELLGGKLWTITPENENTEYYFTIPLKTVDVEPPYRNNLIDKTPDWKDYSFLIAEDEEANFFILTGLLGKTNVHIIRASNGEEAINLYKEHIDKIDLVLMDIRMPVLNGVEATKRILDLNPDAIVIAQTAYAMTEDREIYERTGMKGLLSKPIDPITLYSLCNSFLNK